MFLLLFYSFMLHLVYLINNLYFRYVINYASIIFKAYIKKYLLLYNIFELL